MESSLDQLFSFLVSSEIPSLYQLVEYTLKTMGFFFMLSAIASFKNMRSITGETSRMDTQMVEVPPQAIIAKAMAGAFLFSFGGGNAMIANTLFVSQSFEPYSVEVFRSISCANGDDSGCLHAQLGMFSGDDWQNQLFNQNFFELFTSLIQISGVFAYGRGWYNFSQLGAISTSRQPPTFGGCITQILLGAAAMHPYEFWKLIS